MVHYEKAAYSSSHGLRSIVMLCMRKTLRKDGEMGAGRAGSVKSLGEIEPLLMASKRTVTLCVLLKRNVD